MMPFASPYGSPLYWSFHERPEAWHIDPFHQYAKQLPFFGGGRFTHSTRYHDSSLYGNHGTLTNMDPATDWVRDLGRWALDFNAASSQYVKGTAWNDSVTTLSAACFVKFETASNTWIFNRYYTTPNQRSWGILTSNSDWGAPADGSQLAVSLSTDGTSRMTKLKSYYTGSSCNGAWHHFGFTWNAGTLTLYLDGNAIVPTMEHDSAFTTIHQSTASIGIGAINVDASGLVFVTGNIADSMLWSRVLSPSEIAALADPSNVMYSLGGSDPGLIVPDDLVYPVYLPSSVVAGAKPALWLGVCV